MAATHDKPSLEELEEDLRRAVRLWGDDCATAEALRKIIRKMKKLAKKEEESDAQQEA